MSRLNPFRAWTRILLFLRTRMLFRHAPAFSARAYCALALYLLLPALTPATFAAQTSSDSRADAITRAATVTESAPGPASQAVVVLGAEDDWYPFTGLSKGQLAGFSVELIRAAYAASGTPLELRPLPYSRCMKMARDGEIAGCFNTARNPLLEPHYRWHETPLFLGRILIYARRDHADATLGIENLRGKKLAVTNSYEYGSAFDTDASFIRDVGTSDLFALRKLVAGRVDYALLYERIANYQLRQHPQLANAVKPVGLLSEPALYIAFSRQHPDAARAVALFERGFRQIRDNGEYARIDARWR